MTNSQLVEAWFRELWNSGVESTIDDILAPEMVAHGLGPTGALVGREQFHEFYRAFRTAFPTVHVRLLKVIEAGDYVASQMQVSVAPASGGGPFTFDGNCTIRLQDGHFVEAWNNYDFLGLLTAMGVVPADAMQVALVAAAAPQP